MLILSCKCAKVVRDSFGSTANAGLLAFLTLSLNGLSTISSLNHK